ncbi:DNA methyltransferase, partial [Achromobacter xylosoxidans]|nr:DNA methyltransferase [Achromobacter xylosoxidans]
MSADDQDRPRKTLTIKKTARDAHAEAAPKRVRSGARARLVAQNERAKDNIERQKDPEGYQQRQAAARAARRSADGDRGDGPRRGDGARGDNPRRGDGSRGDS